MNKAPVSQNLRRRPSTNSSLQDVTYFQLNYGSAQSRYEDLEREIDELDIQFGRELKKLQRHFKHEMIKAQDRYKEENRNMLHNVEIEVCDMEKRLQSGREALKEELGHFKAILEKAGLVDCDA